MQELNQIFSVLLAKRCLTDIAKSSDLSEVYNMAGYAIKELYSTNNLDDYFENAGTVNFELAVDKIRMLWHKALTKSNDIKYYNKAIKIATATIIQINTDIDQAIKANNPYKI